MRAGDLSGKVVDAQGAALPSARVSVRNQSGFIVQEAITDVQGEFRIDGLEPGIYYVAVDAEGLIQSSGPQEVRIDNSGAAPITIRLDLSAVRDSIVVSDTRTDSRAAGSASSTYVVSASDLLRAQRPSVLDALRNAPGTNVVQSARRGGVTSLFVRGGESDYTKVLIDGVPVNDAGGAFDFSDLTTDNADRIELVRGAQSALYGSDAMTGVFSLSRAAVRPKHRSLISPLRVEALVSIAKGLALPVLPGGSTMREVLRISEQTVAIETMTMSIERHQQILDTGFGRAVNFG